MICPKSFRAFALVLMGHNSKSLLGLHMSTRTKVAMVAMALALVSIAAVSAQEGKAVEPEYASVFLAIRPFLRTWEVSHMRLLRVLANERQSV